MATDLTRFLIDDGTRPWGQTNRDFVIAVQDLFNNLSVGSGGGNVPLGGIIQWAGAAPPDANTWLGPLPQTGLSKQTYANLYQVVGGGGTDWVAETSGTSADLYGIALSGGQWMAVGTNTAIFSDDNGATWTAATTAPVGVMKRVAGNGSGTWVAVGDNNAVSCSTTYGVAWSTVSIPLAGVWNMTSVKFLNGQFIAVGYQVIGGTYTTGVITSADGLTWTLKTAALTGVGMDVTFNGSTVYLLVGIGLNAYSTNLTAWNLISTTQAFNAVESASGFAVAVGFGGALAYTTSFSNLIPYASPTTNNLYAVTYDGSGWVVAGALTGTESYAYYIPNGETAWRPQSTGAGNVFYGGAADATAGVRILVGGGGAVYSYSATTGDITAWAATVAQPTFDAINSGVSLAVSPTTGTAVVSGNLAAVHKEYRSADAGATWGAITATNQSTTGKLLASASGRFFFVPSGAISYAITYSTDDGSNWTSASTAIPSQTFCSVDGATIVTYGASGSNGKCHFSEDDGQSWATGVANPATFATTIGFGVCESQRYAAVAQTSGNIYKYSLATNSWGGAIATGVTINEFGIFGGVWVLLYLSGGSIYAKTSTDHGATFAGPYTVGTYSDANTVAMGKVKADDAIIVTYDAKMSYSRDGGVTWIEVTPANSPHIAGDATTPAAKCGFGYSAFTDKAYVVDATTGAIEVATYATSAESATFDVQSPIALDNYSHYVRYR
jgi:hypothetical protein